MSNKYAKFGILDVIRSKSEFGDVVGVILDYDFRRNGDRDEVVYEVFSDPNRRWVREDNSELIGRVPPPLQHGAAVSVSGNVVNRKHRIPGHVSGIVWTPETNEWAYSVRLDNGKSVDVEASELRPFRVRANYTAGPYARIVHEARKKLTVRLKRKKDILVPGTPAPKTGIYVIVGKSGHKTRTKIRWRQGDPMPAPAKPGSAWLEVPDEQTLNKHAILGQ